MIFYFIVTYKMKDKIGKRLSPMEVTRIRTQGFCVQVCQLMVTGANPTTHRSIVLKLDYETAWLWGQGGPALLRSAPLCSICSARFLWDFFGVSGKCSLPSLVERKGTLSEPVGSWLNRRKSLCMVPDWSITIYMRTPNPCIWLIQKALSWLIS